MPSPRYLFGSGPSDYAIAPPSRHGGFVVSAPSLGTGTLWSASTGGTQYTDLQTSGGGAITKVSTDAEGSLVPFYGPPGIDAAWLDFGAGTRALLMASHGQDAHVAALLGDSASAATTALTTAVAGLASVTGKVSKGSLVVNVKDHGVVGDGVTDDTAAIQACINANNNVYFPPGTYKSEAIVVSGKTGFRLDMAGRLKRPNNSARFGTLIFLNCSDVRVGTIRTDGNVANNNFGGLPVDEAKHDVRIDGCTDVEIDTIDSLNPAGDGVYIVGATSRVHIKHVRSKSDAATGRNTVSIVNGSGIHINRVDNFGTGYTTMPSGFDIEPNSGQTVTDVTVDSIYSSSSGTGGFTVFGGYTSESGGDYKIKRIKIGDVTVVKGTGVASGACDVPIRGVQDLSVGSLSITQDAASVNQALSIDESDLVSMFVNIPRSGGAVPPNIGASAAVTRLKLSGSIGQSGSHCLNIYSLSDSDIDMRLRDPASLVLVVKQATGTSTNVRFRGDWRKVTGSAAMQINGTCEWVCDADLTSWPQAQRVIGSGAAGVTFKSGAPQAVYNFTTAGQSSWTVPTAAKTLRVIAVGAGGGGGAGRRDAAGTTRFGGGGGGAGSRSDLTLDGSAYAGTSLTVTVGAGGAGAAAQTADTSSGANGTAGGWSGVGTSTAQSTAIVNANGGNGGSGGTATTGTAGSGVAGTTVGTTGGAGSNGSVAGGLASWSIGTTGGSGGGGGGITSANAAAAGGGGGFPASGYPAYTAAGAAGANGTDGANSTSPTQGYGGGGGGASNGGAAGNGGNGGTPGGAGGGGGASVNGTNSGSGGNGAAGAVQIIVTF